MGFLKKIFGGGGSGDDQGMYFYVRCEKCGEPIRIRVNPANDLSPTFEDEDRPGDNPTGYEINKQILGNRCFKLIEATWRFDEKKRKLGSEIQGGREITAEEYEREAAAST